ncbi:SH3 domain-containing C40 family peptidase [Wukongibacter baidiensis]|uniref:C40 family peptidase n=1 Tax=Wukongibacter baidiensis TaxID=1723361 RepID=UPI003D7F6E15
MNKVELGHGIINKTVASIRTKPNGKSSLADEGLLGMVVKLINLEDNGWYYVETHYKYKGYIHENDLVIDNERALSWSKEADYLIVHSVVDIMKEPNYQNYVVEMATRGSIMKVTGNKKDKWVEVILPSLERGWVKGEYIEKKREFNFEKDENILRESLVQTASKYLGTQYRWGGKSPLGIDCSGLCSMSYMLNGIIIWRDAELRDEYMREITREEMKKGDLLFYKGHVGMYIGDEKVIHSASSKCGVVINSLNKDDNDYNKYLDEKLIAVGTIF